MIRRLVWTAGPARRNRGYKPYFRRIAAAAAMSREAFTAWQADEVRAHVQWATETIPYLREQAPGAERLQDLPILTREIVQAHAEGLIDPTRPREALQENASGGSTGQPVRVWQDEAYWQHEFATETWLYHWWGLEPWCAKAYLWGNDLDPQEEYWKAKLEARLAGEYSLNVFAVDKDAIEAFAKRLEAKRPPVLLGYASALELFAAHVEDRGGIAWKPRLVRSAAEALHPERRARIERGLGVPVVDFYGSRESASLAAQWHDRRFYVLEHGRVLEIVDDAGEPVPPGVPGRVLVTDFTNRAFGLVRYENGDVASFAPQESRNDAPCPYRTIERVHGRTSDFITTPSGMRIHGEWFTHLFYGVEAVTRFQVRQHRPEQVRLLTEGPADETVLAPILAKMRERLGPEVEVTWEAVASIPLTKTGKWRFTVSDVPFRAGAS